MRNDYSEYRPEGPHTTDPEWVERLKQAREPNPSIEWNRLESYELSVWPDGTGIITHTEYKDGEWRYGTTKVLDATEVGLVKTCLESNGQALRHYINQMGRWHAREREERGKRKTT